MGESVHIIVLDTFVAVVAGLIMFPACFTYGVEVNAGQGLKVRPWMKPLFRYVVPAAILFIYVYGMATFQWK